jgi:hypothetical protein
MAMTLDGTSGITQLTGSIVMSGSTSGTVTIIPTATAGSNTATLPAATGTVMVSGNMPAFYAYNSSSQSLTNNTFTKVSLNAENFDTNSNFDSTTNYRFTPTVAGYYAFSAGCGLTGPATVVQFVLDIRKNGSVYGPRFIDMNPSASLSSNSFINLSGSTIIQMNGSTDYVELFAYAYGPSATGISVSTGGNGAYFCGNLIRNT